MMRRHLARYPHTLGPRAANQIERLRGGNVSDMNRRIGFQSDRKVAADSFALGLIRISAEAKTSRDLACVHRAVARKATILFMQRDRKAKALGAIERTPEKSGIVDGDSIVGK